jgi:hypothetical protein
MHGVGGSPAEALAEAHNRVALSKALVRAATEAIADSRELLAGTAVYPFSTCTDACCAPLLLATCCDESAA